jgi:GNAT superfamily N-acetyltransferase
MLRIRPAAPDDTALVLALIRELAEYERLAHTVVASEADLREALFGPRPWAETVLADVDGQPAGFALYFHNFSTFLARPGLYLEDLFVRPAFRRQGVGRALLVHLAQLAALRRCGRFEWTVLDWNTPAIAFYEKLGAQLLPDWRVCRLTGEGLTRFAKAGGVG